MRASYPAVPDPIPYLSSPAVSCSSRASVGKSAALDATPPRMGLQSARTTRLLLGTLALAASFVRTVGHRVPASALRPRGAALSRCVRGKTRRTDARASQDASAEMSGNGYYRRDGVRIQHDPYAPGMAEKYGNPGETDDEGFDPYAGCLRCFQPSSPQRHHPATPSCRCALKPVHHADSVGPGIYGGKVKRDDQGNVIIGKQFQNHNPTPGPVYAGGGYTAMSKALSQVRTCVRVQGRAMRGGIPFKCGLRPDSSSTSGRNSGQGPPRRGPFAGKSFTHMHPRLPENFRSVPAR